MCTDLVEGKLCSPLQHEEKFQEEGKIGSLINGTASNDSR